MKSKRVVKRKSRKSRKGGGIELPKVCPTCNKEMLTCEGPPRKIPFQSEYQFYTLCTCNNPECKYYNKKMPIHHQKW